MLFPIPQFQSEEKMQHLLAKKLIRDIPDFPKPGILFRDITPVLASPEAMREVMDQFISLTEKCLPDVIIGIESRGFVLGMPLALEMGLPFVPVRKAGKLPWDHITEEYALEYGTNSVEIHRDAIQQGQKVLIVDDLLATGGTAAASCRLVVRLGGTVCGCFFLIELAPLCGRSVLQDVPVHSLIAYD
jgi:adenine phosphoribosyltransferase